jgi:arginine:ornithine antiporter/lysine permease
MTNIVVQLFLIATLFSQNAFFMALELTSAMSLIPYLLVAAYGFKLAFTWETYDRNSPDRTRGLIIAAIAVIYSVLMLYAGGLDNLLLSGLILTPGTLLFFLARREQNQTVFKSWEWFFFTVIAIAAISAIYGLSTGLIKI